MKTLTVKQVTLETLIADDKFAKQCNGERMVVSNEIFKGYQCVNVVDTLKTHPMKIEVISSYFIESNDDLTDRLILSEMEVIGKKWERDTEKH